ncbi:hypothetical protein C4J85_2229 [Pseudomonas sp. R4-34-07]|nr:hypothetical protein C4J85_2229 [Pseudomonas sp. R4-34-07]
MLLCLPTGSQEECALITALKRGDDKSLGTLGLILFCTPWTANQCAISGRVPVSSDSRRTIRTED